MLPCAFYWGYFILKYSCCFCCIKFFQTEHLFSVMCQIHRWCCWCFSHSPHYINLVKVTTVTKIHDVECFFNPSWRDSLILYQFVPWTEFSTAVFPTKLIAAVRAFWLEALNCSFKLAYKRKIALKVPAGKPGVS